MAAVLDMQAELLLLVYSANKQQIFMAML